MQLAVAVVKKMGDIGASESLPKAAARYAADLHDRWGVGDEGAGNGVVLLLSEKDRQVRHDVRPARERASRRPARRCAVLWGRSAECVVVCRCIFRPAPRRSSASRTAPSRRCARGGSGAPRARSPAGPSATCAHDAHDAELTTRTTPLCQVIADMKPLLRAGHYSLALEKGVRRPAPPPACPISTG